MRKVAQEGWSVRRTVELNWLQRLIAIRSGNTAMTPDLSMWPDTYCCVMRPSQAIPSAIHRQT